MRLSINQKMAGTAIFLLLATLVVGSLLLLSGMPFGEAALDRALNVPLTIVAAFQQESFRIVTNRFIERYQGRKRYQVLRPILGIAGLFLVQAALYAILMMIVTTNGPGVVLGVVNLLAGSTLLWIWQQKWRWIVLQWEWGSRHVRVRLALLQQALNRIAPKGPQ